jgi:hypothetical protein
MKLALPHLHGRRCAALVAGAAAVVALGVESSASSTQVLCARSSAQPKVGTLTKILHTTVFVAGTYVAAAPCDVIRDDEVKTDSRGEAVFRLSVAGRVTRCVVLPLARGRAYPTKRSGAVLDFISGRSWCSTTGGNRTSFFLARGIKIVSTQAIFGIDVGRRVTIKVYSGSLRINNKTALRPRLEMVLSPTGKIIRRPRAAVFDADDGLAIAQLR